ncbi:OLC1v1009579C1 [Oldenlandia corymbosa var. corymbosa]|uniref:OLC1v1009579C1 n=1 Tax=Oldenlandia corymbosa var. corymbosa TaxID=529605 RepID=A0AAV1DPA3_OLDCO|nr:OLC1v1009579C1 [Oldenlandia corymbosa var. corymbosa]
MDQQPENYQYTSITIPLLIGEVNIANDPSTKAKPEYNIVDSVTPGGSTSFYRTCLNVVNFLSGVGILALPYALVAGGWLSLTFLFVIASCAFYSGLLIRRCMDMDSSIRSFPDMGERAFGTKGRALVSFFMHTELYIGVTGFMILEGDNLNNIFPGVSFRIDGFVNIGGKESFVVLAALIILPTVWLKDLSLLSVVSGGGVLATLILVCSIVWNGAFDGIGFHKKGTLMNWKGIPTAISLFSLSSCSHPVFPSIYPSMSNPKQYSKVMIVSFFICTVTYAFIAIMGYLMFGQEVMSQISGIYQRFGYELMLIVGIVFVGIISAITGTYTALVELVRHYHF